MKKSGVVFGGDFAPFYMPLKLVEKKKALVKLELFVLFWGIVRSHLAVRTGLEPATPCVTGKYSNQLNYRTKIFKSYLSFEAGQK